MTKIFVWEICEPPLLKTQYKYSSNYFDLYNLWAENLIAYVNHRIWSLINGCHIVVCSDLPFFFLFPFMHHQANNGRFFTGQIEVKVINNFILIKFNNQCVAFFLYLIVYMKNDFFIWINKNILSIVQPLFPWWTEILKYLFLLQSL